MQKERSKFKIENRKVRRLLKFRNPLLETKYNFMGHLYHKPTEKIILESCYSAVANLLKFIGDLSYTQELQQDFTKLLILQDK